MPAASAYTDEEKQFIRDNYLRHGKQWDGWAPLLARHPWKGIQNKAKRLGYGRRAWTAKDEAYLVRRFAEIGGELGRTPLACSKRLASLTDHSYRLGHTGEWADVPVTAAEYREALVD